MKNNVQALMKLIERGSRKVSISLIQRTSSVGFNEACEIAESLVDGGALIVKDKQRLSYELSPEIILMGDLTIVNTALQCKETL